MGMLTGSKGNKRLLAAGKLLYTKAFINFRVE
jgi:hypothetical protein